LEQLLMTNGYSKEDLIIVSVPTADQVSVMVSSASLIAESTIQEGSIRKSSVGEGPLRKTSTSSVEKKVSFDRGISIQEESETKVEGDETPEVPEQ
jgi:conserved oligomeric Golgi complex subunit 3